MATVVAPGRLLTTDRDAALAANVLTELDGPDGSLAVQRPGVAPRELPREVGLLLQQVLQAVASGHEVSVSAVPPELTTSTAASLLGISRPTLMKMVERGELPAHKVGTHTRLNSADIFAFVRARQERRRAAFDELRELLDT